MTSAIVVDTMVASAWLAVRDSARKTRWQPVLTQSQWVLPFTVVAEMRFGAEVAGWGARRRGRPRPPRDFLQGDAPARRGDRRVRCLRTRCVRNGHGLWPRSTKPTDGWPRWPSLRSFPSRARTRSSTESRNSNERSRPRDHGRSPSTPSSTPRGDTHSLAVGTDRHVQCAKPHL